MTERTERSEGHEGMPKRHSMTERTERTERSEGHERSEGSKPGVALPQRLPAAGARPRGGGPPWMHAGLPAEKSMNFVPSAKRLFARLRPQYLRLCAVTGLAIVSVTLSVLGPKVLGHATDLIFAGVVGKRLPAGQSLQQVVAHERAAGHGRIADMLAGMDVVPGAGIDFNRVGHVLMLALGLYVLASVLAMLQGLVLNGVVQRTILDLRAEVEDKVHRLPLPYFDNQPRGELLSRVTNDIDNISQSLQQTLSQLLTSLLTVIGVLVMMFVISPVLAVIALVIVPVSIVVTKQIAKRSQKQFIAQWKHTGSLNGQIEEAFTGHELVKVFGRRR